MALARGFIGLAFAGVSTVAVAAVDPQTSTPEPPTIIHEDGGACIVYGLEGRIGDRRITKATLEITPLDAVIILTDRFVTVVRGDNGQIIPDQYFTELDYEQARRTAAEVRRLCARPTR